MNKPHATAPAPWVLVADRSQARLLQALPGNRTLLEVETIEHPEGRLRDHELVSDSPGLTRGPGYAQGAPAAPKETPGEHEAKRFARQLAERITALRNDNAIARLYLIAEPHFLGLLRAELDAPTQQLVAGEVGRRLVDQSPAELLAVLPKVL